MNNLIKAIDGRNINTLYDPRRAIDGGGYWQPRAVAVLATYGGETVLTIQDENCGMFGRKFSAIVEAEGEAPQRYELCSLSNDEVERKGVKIVSNYNETMDSGATARLLREVLAIGNAIARAKVRSIQA